MQPLNWDIKDRSIKNIIYRFVKLANTSYEYLFKSKLYNTRINERGVKRVVSDKFQLVYLENPLAASRSIIEKIRMEDEGLREERGRVGEEGKYITFSVCRNPWERLVSCYNKKILNANNVKKIGIVGQYEGLRPQMSFESFLQWISSDEGKDENADPHWATQHTILTASDGRLSCDEVLRLENLKDQFVSLSERVGFRSSRLPTRASSDSQMYDRLFEDYRGYYRGMDDELLQGVAERYKIDCQTFGYPTLNEYVRRKS